MTQTLSAEKLTLYQLERSYGIAEVEEPDFFFEWQAELPQLSPAENERLERIKLIYKNIERRAALEDAVKLAVISPLIDMAGFFLPPFYASTETSVQLALEDEDEVIRGRIDVLVVQEQLWILAIEAKRVGFSLAVGIPQALAYLLARPQRDRSGYALVTNGNDFIFLKVSEPAQFARSQQFTLTRGDDLAQVLKIMKHLGQVMTAD